MKNSRLIPSDLLHSIDVTNTLGGGVSQPFIELNQHESHREIKCRVPGVLSSSLSVEITNNFLSIFYTHQIKSNEVGIQLPRIIYHKAIPYFIDQENISALIDDDCLCVRLPFNELSNGYHKKVSIQ